MRRWRHGRRASTSRFTWRCCGRTAPSTSITYSPSHAPSASKLTERARQGRTLPGCADRAECRPRNVLGVWGAPAFVIGDGIIRSALPQQQFRAATADARVARKARGTGAAPTEAGSVLSRPCRGRRRGPRRIVCGYDPAGSKRGRDAGCPAPPARIRTCPLRHPAPPSGCASHAADGKSLIRPRVSDFQLGTVCRGQFCESGPIEAVPLRSATQYG